MLGVYPKQVSKSNIKLIRRKPSNESLPVSGFINFEFISGTDKPLPVGMLIPDCFWESCLSCIEGYSDENKIFRRLFNNPEDMTRFFSNMNDEEIARWLVENKVVFFADFTSVSAAVKWILRDPYGLNDDLFYFLRNYVGNHTVDQAFDFQKSVARYYVAQVDPINPGHLFIWPKSYPILMGRGFVPNRFISNDGLINQIAMNNPAQRVEFTRVRPIINNDVISYEYSRSTQNYMPISWLNLDHIPTQPAVTIGFSFGVNGFVPIITKNQGPYSSKHMFDMWAGLAQVGRTTIDTSRLGGYNVNIAGSSQHMTNGSFGQPQNSQDEVGSSTTRVRAYYGKNLNLAVPTEGGYIVSENIFGEGDIVEYNGKLYSVESSHGSPYSTNGYDLILQPLEGY